MNKETYRDIILDAIADGVFTVDRSWRITTFNRAAEEITGVPRQEAIGRPCREVLKADICEHDCALKQTIESGTSIIGKRVTIINAAGEQTPVSISTALLRNDAGQVIGAVETFRDMSVVENLRKKIEGRYTFEDIISKNHRMYELFSILPDIAESASTVLIEGESGTGKELFAQAIHHLSHRRTKPFIVVNCAALPDTLLEAELFGYKAGAFTDAKRDKPGRFKQADGGTIFLDEIGDISPALQVRLLRVLQEKSVEPLGGVGTETVDVHIIAATNKKLEDLVSRNLFREDLYYRINVISLELPPLRERTEDIPLLVEHFIRNYNSLQKKNISGITDEALMCLMNYDFPGNIRELENIIERAFILCKNNVIDRHHIPDALCGRREMHLEAGLTSSFKDMERLCIENALKRNNGSRIKTARDLGIHKSTLYRKMKALGIGGRKIAPER